MTCRRCALVRSLLARTGRTLHAGLHEVVDVLTGRIFAANSQEPIMGLSSITPIVDESYAHWRDVAGLPFYARCALLGVEELRSFDPPPWRAPDVRAGAFGWPWSTRGVLILQGCHVDVRTGAHADQLRAAWWELQCYDHVLCALHDARDLDGPLRALTTEWLGTDTPATDAERAHAYAVKWCGLYIDDMPPQEQP